MTANAVPLGVTRDQARAYAPVPGFAEVSRRGSLSVELYRPRGHDGHSPHERDELYMVLAGTGAYRCGAAGQASRPGDLLFAPAGEAHRFENFTDDLEVWVLFYGPEGGERPGGRVVLGREVRE